MSVETRATFDKTKEEAALGPASRGEPAATDMFRQFFEMGLVGMAITSPAGHWIEINDEFCRMLGYSREELTSLTWVDLTHPDDVEDGKDLVQRLLEGEIDTYSRDKRMIRKDGSILHIGLSTKVKRGPDGSVEYIASIGRNLIRKMKAEAEALEAQRRYKALFTAFDEGVAVIEMILDDTGEPVDFRFLEVNDAFERRGRLHNVLEGKTAREMLPNMEPYWLENFGQVVKTGETVRFENYLQEVDLWFEACAFRLDGPASPRIGVMFRDMTEQKRAEAAILETHEQLRRANRIKDEFLGLVSHELRTPLTMILGNSMLLSRLGTGSSAEEREAIKDIASESVRLQRIVENLLLLTRLEAQQTRPEPVSLPSLIRESVEVFQKRVPSRQISVMVQPGSPVALGESKFIVEVFDNLLSNADKYSPIDKPIDVVLCCNAAGRPEVQVRDYGEGIDPDEVESVFEPFYRAESAATQMKGGIGLGLTVCKRLIEAQGGSIWASRLPEGGSAFCFELAQADLNEPSHLD